MNGTVTAQLLDLVSSEVGVGGARLAINLEACCCSSCCTCLILCS